MKSLRIGCAAINSTPLDWVGNREKILAVLDQARTAGVHLISFPELCVSGYGCEDLFLAPWVAKEAHRSLQLIAPHTSAMIAVVGIPIWHKEKLYNCAAVLCDGKIRGYVPKQHLARDGLHYEPRWFSAASPGSISVHEDGVPFGDLTYYTENLRLGFEICEDGWVENRPGTLLAQRGCTVIMNLSASHFAPGKAAQRERLVVESSKALGVTYVYSNLLGCEAGRIIYDGDTLIAHHGSLCARGPRLSFAQTNLTAIDVAVSDLTLKHPPHTELDISLERANRLSASPESLAHRSAKLEPSQEPAPYSRSAFCEFESAATLGLFDYLRKSGARGFALSLSGGCDSTTIACLVRIMIERALQELGLPTFLRSLNLCSEFATDPAASVDTLIRKLLICVYQATQNSSHQSRESAKSTAEMIGAPFVEVEIDSLVEQYESLCAQITDRRPTWEEHDLARQNIQARARAPLIWMVANIRQAILLTTSNRSEAAVGYATMDGDTAGGLAPLGSVPKSFLREYLRWIERHGPASLEGATAWRELARVNKLQPSAELRPIQTEQTDEKDLMPYEVLDRIEVLFVQKQIPPHQIPHQLMDDFSARYPAAQLTTWTNRFLSAFRVSQWKRERFAPSFHLGDYNLDPRSWFRAPIFCGSLTTEGGGMSRIALVGGAFDPPHNGHLSIIETLRQSRLVDSVWIVPSGERGDKRYEASCEQRRDMASLFAAACTSSTFSVRVEPIQISEELPGSFTIDLLVEFSHSHPTTEFFTVIGSELLADLPRWKSYDTLLQRARFLIIPRPGDNAGRTAPPQSIWLTPPENLACAASSSEIRRRARQGIAVDELLPPSIAAYIKKHRLYVAV